MSYPGKNTYTIAEWVKRSELKKSLRDFREETLVVEVAGVIIKYKYEQ